MKKKIITLVLSLMLCLGVVPSMTACTKKSDVTVFLMANSIENAFYKKHFESVASEKGFSIGYTGQASANYYRLLRNEINKGKTPDIFYVRPSDIRSFIKDGLVADISSELAAYSETLDKVYDSAKDMYKYDPSSKTWGQGGTYAIPKDLSVQQLGYNKKLINANRSVLYNYYNAPEHAAEKAAMPHFDGGEIKLPWEMDWENENYTWSQYKTMAAVLAANGKALDKETDQLTAGKIYGCDFPSYELLMWSFGGTLLSNDLQTVNVQSEAFQKAGKYLAALVDEGAANYQGATFDTFTGERNVCFYGGVNSFDIKNYDDTLGKNQWDIMPWPVADASGEFAPVADATVDTDKWYGIITSAGYAVSKSCKNKARAGEVIMTLLDEEVQTSIVAEEKLQL
ncbi:MAG: extracellular solute-binding protein, partial [Clostridiales bacterium]|nr:extracellular solute-binding protein [Clostridiales bacterium]